MLIPAHSSGGELAGYMPFGPRARSIPSVASRSVLPQSPRMVVRMPGFGPAAFGLGFMPGRLRRGMGASGSAQTGEAVGKAISTAAIATGPAAPFVAAAGSLVSIISSFLTGGCGSACTESAQATQVWGTACDDLSHVAQAGMLGQEDYATGIENFISAGVQQMNQLYAAGDTRATPSNLNLTQGNVDLINQIPAQASVPLDLTKVQAMFVQPGYGGWTLASIEAGDQLAFSYLQAVAAGQTSGVSASGVSTSSSGLTIAGMTFSYTEAGLALAALVGLYLLSGRA